MISHIYISVTLAFSGSFSLMLSHSLAFYLAFSRIRSNSRAFSPILSHSLSFALSLILSQSPTLSLSLSLSLTHTRKHTHTHTHAVWIGPTGVPEPLSDSPMNSPRMRHTWWISRSRADILLNQGPSKMGHFAQETSYLWEPTCRCHLTLCPGTWRNRSERTCSHFLDSSSNPCCNVTRRFATSVNVWYLSAPIFLRFSYRNLFPFLHCL